MTELVGLALRHAGGTPLQVELVPDRVAAARDSAKRAPFLISTPRRLSGKLYPAVLDGPARQIGRSAWRYMQWTRRHRPEALARVAFVRSTMRPYTFFDEA